ncbi:hypothetical protein Tco_0983980 [Tanacetum coccineum]
MDSRKDLADVGVIEIAGVNDTTFMKKASLEILKMALSSGLRPSDKKYNGNVKIQNKEQISMRELEYRIEEHYEGNDDGDHDGAEDFRDGFHDEGISEIE